MLADLVLVQGSSTSNLKGKQESTERPIRVAIIEDILQRVCPMDSVVKSYTHVLFETYTDFLFETPCAFVHSFPHTSEFHSYCLLYGGHRIFHLPHYLSHVHT